VRIRPISSQSTMGLLREALDTYGFEKGLGNVSGFSTEYKHLLVCQLTLTSELI
jgi:hypothetical protein